MASSAVIKQKETMQTLRAFEYWISLGDKRTYKAVAEREHVAVKTVFNWYHSFNWQKKLEERQLERAKLWAKDTDQMFLDNRIKNINRLSRTLDEYDKYLIVGKVDASSIQDMLNTTKMQNDLMNELDHGLADPIKKKSAEESESGSNKSRAIFSITTVGEDY